MTAQTANTPEPIMQFFTYAHLPPHLQAVSKPFCDMAMGIIITLPRNPERTVALRKLLESKDAAVRALLYKEPPERTDPVQPTISENPGLTL